MSDKTITSAPSATGVALGAAAYLIWGLFPLYWSALADVPALQLLAHRAVWCAVAVWGWLLLQRDLGWMRQITPRRLAALALGGVLISINWGVYVLAVTTGHVIDTSLGYFITPLVNVLFAVWILRERLSRSQALAVIIAAAGVLYLGWELGAPPWIALLLACSFGLYGLVRKLTLFDAVHGLAAESGVMLLPAIAYLMWCQWHGTGTFLHGRWGDDLLLVAGGAVTAIPLVLFAMAVQRVSMIALGVLQYIAPTVALLLGLVVYHEPFGGARRAAFICIWLALALFTGEALWRYTRSRKAAPA
ncbi:MAG: EamA family transporter RarD [Pseudomonadota bacterium]